jgi:hypothetical protein
MHLLHEKAADALKTESAGTLYEDRLIAKGKAAEGIGELSRGAVEQRSLREQITLAAQGFPYSYEPVYTGPSYRCGHPLIQISFIAPYLPEVREYKSSLSPGMGAQKIKGHDQ